MKITEIETFAVGAGWKNWLFVRVHTDAGITGLGEGTLNGFIRPVRERTLFFHIGPWLPLLAGLLLGALFVWGRGAGSWKRPRKGRPG